MLPIISFCGATSTRAGLFLKQGEEARSSADVNRHSSAEASGAVPAYLSESLACSLWSQSIAITLGDGVERIDILLN